MKKALWLSRLGGAGGVPIGTVVSFIGGYFGNSSNGTFTNVLGNDITTLNGEINAEGWYVCDGSELNDPDSLIFNGAGRYLPRLTNNRFIMGDTAAGIVGGSNSMQHTHSTSSHTLTTSQIPSHKHTISNAGNNQGLNTHYGTASYVSGLNTATSSSVGSGNSHSHGNTGGSTNTENRPSFLSCLYIMKVK